MNEPSHRKLRYIAIDGWRNKTAHDSFLRAQSHLEKVSFGRPCMIASSLGELFYLMPNQVQRGAFLVRSMRRK